MKNLVLIGLLLLSKIAFAQGVRNEALIKQLAVIHDEDQKYREQIETIQNKYGFESPEMKDLWKTINRQDSLNLIEIEVILSRYGWLGADVVGDDGNATLFLVIQHSNITVQEKYLPMMRDAVKKGRAKAGSLALLEDRVALRQGKRQSYGSQISWDMKTNEYYVLPLDDPDNVDKRRAGVGLPPMADYISHWNMKWDVEQYKKDLPAIEAKGKKL